MARGSGGGRVSALDGAPPGETDVSAGQSGGAAHACVTHASGRERAVGGRPLLGTARCLPAAPAAPAAPALVGFSRRPGNPPRCSYACGVPARQRAQAGAAADLRRALPPSPLAPPPPVCQLLLHLCLPVPPKGHAGGPQAHGRLLQRLPPEPRAVCWQGGAGRRHRQRHPGRLCRQSGCVWCPAALQGGAGAPLRDLPACLAACQRGLGAESVSCRSHTRADESPPPRPPPPLLLQARARCTRWRRPAWRSTPSGW